MFYLHFSHRISQDRVFYKRIPRLPPILCCSIVTTKGGDLRAFGPFGNRTKRGYDQDNVRISCHKLACEDQSAARTVNTQYQRKR